MADAPPQKGIRFYIYRRPNKYAALQKGFPGSPVPDYPTDSLDQITVVGEGVSGRSEPTEDAPAYRLVARPTLGDQIHWHVEPIGPPAHYTPGGNWAMSAGTSRSDFPGGFPHEHPIPVFDRIERPLK